MCTVDLCHATSIFHITNCLGPDSEVASSKAAFSVKFKALLWTLTTGLQFFVGWWYSKSAVFYLPSGWFGPLGWWLSFPFAPAGRSDLFQRTASPLTRGAGSVSVGVWQMACKRVIAIGERVVKDLAGKYHLTYQSPQSKFSP
jgi:hypothetical protein